MIRVIFKDGVHKVFDADYIEYDKNEHLIELFKSPYRIVAVFNLSEVAGVVDEDKCRTVE